MRFKNRVALLALLLVGACRGSTALGECVGFNEVERADLRYEYSARNIVVGIVFFGLIAPPVVVALHQLKCPVERIAPRAGSVTPDV
ncbi:MAG TPA: hypothetical protein VIK52_06765 [Opitutaceae bacterium]